MYRIIEGNTNTQNAKYIAVTFLVAMMSKVNMQNVSHHWRKYEDMNTQNEKYIAVTFLVAMMSKVEAKM